MIDIIPSTNLIIIFINFKLKLINLKTIITKIKMKETHYEKKLFLFFFSSLFFCLCFLFLDVVLILIDFYDFDQKEHTLNKNR